jgi:hypothetical protein
MSDEMNQERKRQCDQLLASNKNPQVLEVPFRNRKSVERILEGDPVTRVGDDLRSPIAPVSLADDEDSRELVLQILIDASDRVGVPCQRPAHQRTLGGAGSSRSRTEAGARESSPPEGEGELSSSSQ